MAKRHRPRKGSMAFSPRKRAKRERPRVHSWKDTGENKILGFTGYKAGMTHVLAMDNRKNSPTSGMEISLPVTVIDTPPMKVIGARLYSNGYNGLTTRVDIKKDVEKKLEKYNKEEVSDLRLLVSTQPNLTSMPKKKPEMMEMAIGGTLDEKLEFAKNNIGKEIRIEEIVTESQFVDVTAVTKGKGFQGVVKRWGAILQPRKAGKGRRHLGSGGSWKPAHKLRTEPLPGQMGYHTRTEFNKLILKLGKDGKEVTPAGGFLRYGDVKGDYILLQGSVQGPAKRIVRITTPRRPKKEVGFEITHINTESKQGA